MSAAPYISCRELIDFILDYLEGDLEPQQRFEFERHLAVCRSCRAYLQTYQATLELEKMVRVPRDLSEVPEDLVEAILASRSG